jgi:hypothetical protein
MPLDSLKKSLLRWALWRRAQPIYCFITLCLTNLRRQSWVPGLLVSFPWRLLLWPCFGICPGHIRNVTKHNLFGFFLVYFRGFAVSLALSIVKWHVFFLRSIRVGFSDLRTRKCWSGTMLLLFRSWIFPKGPCERLCTQLSTIGNFLSLERWGLVGGL